MENKENKKSIAKRKREKSSKKKKYDEINSESLSNYESISEGDEDIVEEVEIEENENEINTIFLHRILKRKENMLKKQKKL